MSSNVLVTITTYGQGALSDILGLEVYAKPGTWVSTSFSFGQTVSFEVPNGVWGRIRSQLSALSQRRIPAMDVLGVALGTGHTQPLISYSVDYVPGDRPRVHQVEGVPLSVGTPLALTLRGENLLGGLVASSMITTFEASFSYGYPGTATYKKAKNVLRFDALAKGPLGNQIAYSIQPESGAGSVTVTLGSDGLVYVKIVPAAAASTSTAIAAQVGSTNASAFMTATALIASAPVPPTVGAPGGNGPSPGGATPSNAGQLDRVYLSGGDGGGIAVIDVPVVAGVPTNRLRVTANKAGNDGNFLTLTLLMSQLANSVVVTGTNIVVSRTGATETVANLVAALAGSAPAAALVTASAVGAGAVGALTKSWFYGGAGETPSAKVAGAPATITAHTDTSIVMTVTAPALATAGALAGEQGMIQIAMNYGLVSAPVTLAA